MRTIENPANFRKNIASRFKILVDQEICASNLEKGVFNYAIKKARDASIVRKWDNPEFIQLYLNRLRSVYINLSNTSELVELLKQKKLTPQKMAFMTHQEMRPSQWQTLIEKKKFKDESKYAPQLDANTDNFTCRRCKSKRCSYYQLQTRSADEPMTTFVTCIDCGNRWKC